MARFESTHLDGFTTPFADAVFARPGPGDSVVRLREVTGEHCSYHLRCGIIHASPFESFHPPFDPANLTLKRAQSRFEISCLGLDLYLLAQILHQSA